MSPSKSKEKGEHSHEAYFKKAHIKSSSESVEIIISAQAKTEDEAINIFKTIKELMEE